MADATATPVARAFQPVTAAEQAFAVYSALARAGRDDAALLVNPLWQIFVEQSRELFLDAFEGIVS